MAGKRLSQPHENRTYNVAVVGLSGTEKEKGISGIGKSCLINRFVRPAADDYLTDHISVLSQSDFAGRVVNNDHFLYWGETVKTDEGCDWRFRVIEQTEFVDDSSFQSFRIGKPDPYHKRCATLRLQSAEKLAYICKNQLGLEHEFHQELLPDGRISIDGFLCLFDVSHVSQRPVERQVEHVALILSQLIKTKKPVVFVLTKCDIAFRPYINEAEKLVNRKELKDKGAPMLIVETSAHQNVNVEAAFLALAHAIDRTNPKNRSRISTYVDAARARDEVVEVAREAFSSLVRSQVNDHNSLWEPLHRRLSKHPDYIHYVELAGTERAARVFQEHIRQLREEFKTQRTTAYLRRLESILRDILPDLNTIADRSWYSILPWLRRQPFFDQFFVVGGSADDGCSPLTIDQMTALEMSGDQRIPSDLLECEPAEQIFRNHVTQLRTEFRKTELKSQFKQLLEANHHVGPGKSLNEVAIFFIGRDCFTSLSEKDKQEIYEAHQKSIKERARRDFLELLLENAEEFARFEQDEVTNDDIRIINEQLQHEPRYQALARMESDRKVQLLSHLGFIQSASKNGCPFGESCANVLCIHVLSSRTRRPQSWSRNSQFLLDAQDNKLNFVILGSNGLASQLAQEIQMQCTEDEYTLDGELFTLVNRVIDGDVGLPQNSFKTENFTPHGCFCVFNSTQTLEYIRRSLEKTLLSDLQREDRLPFQGLPIVLVLGHKPDMSEKNLIQLRTEGQLLADKVQCPFVDVPSSMMSDSSNRLFHEDQIGLAMHNLVKRIKHRSVFVNPWHTAESIEPDLRILLCLHCGDGFNVELPLAPLLNHQFCYVTSDDYIALETYLDDSKRKVEVTATSYHGASQLRHCLYHGYILVYCTKRRSSLANLRSFAKKVCSVPTKILAVTETGVNHAFFSSESSQSLLTDGNSFADSIRASFMTTCANFQQQTASYTPFFKECWERKAATERAFSFSRDDGMGSGGGRNGVGGDVPNQLLHERMKLRPPAALPSHLMSSTMAKSSTSNSADDSDPAFIDPPVVRPSVCSSESDREGCRSSSISPRLRGRSRGTHGGGGRWGGVGGDEGSIYSEIGRDTDLLIKPVKARRNVYADRYRKSFPGASSSFTSGYYCDVSTDTEGSINSPKLRVNNSQTLHNPVRSVVDSTSLLPAHYAPSRSVTNNNQVLSSRYAQLDLLVGHQSMTRLDSLQHATSVSSHALIESCGAAGESKTCREGSSYAQLNASYRPTGSRQSAGAHRVHDDTCKQITTDGRCCHGDSLVNCHGGAQPHYQFRKSNSMKLALNEDEEEEAESSATEYGGADGAGSKKQSTTSFKPFQQRKQKQSDSRGAGLLPLQSCSTSVLPAVQPLHADLVKAPLATPEPIEFADYAQVNDALSSSNTATLVSLESNYASVADALPIGRLHRIRPGVGRGDQGNRDKSDSDSELSSSEATDNPWVNRRQQAILQNKNKKKNGGGVHRGARRTDLSGSSGGFLVDDHQALILSDQLDEVNEYSEDAAEASEDTAEDFAGGSSSAVQSTAASGAVHRLKKKRSVRSKKTSMSVDRETSRRRDDSSEFRPTRVVASSIDAEYMKVGSVDDRALSSSPGGGGPVWQRKLRLNSDTAALSSTTAPLNLVPHTVITLRHVEDRRREREEEQRRKSKTDKNKNKTSAAQRKSKKKSQLLPSTLEDVVQSADHPLIPLFVHKCVSYLEEEGLGVEGLYRVPGSKLHVDLLMERFKQDPSVDLCSLDVPVNAVATALKQFFSDLSEPVIPTTFYEQLKDACNLPDRTLRLLALRGILNKLPAVNYAVLKYVITHIHRVSTRSSENSMDSKNLSIVWWPTLMWPKITSLDTMYLTSRPLEEVIQLLIEQLQFFFYPEQ